MLGASREEANPIMGGANTTSHDYQGLPMKTHRVALIELRIPDKSKSGEAWRREAGDLYISGLHALLREASEQWSIHRLAENGEEAHGGQAACN